MKRYLYMLILVMIPTMLMAQAAGGTIKRPSVKSQTAGDTNKHTSAKSQTKVMESPKTIKREKEEKVAQKINSNTSKTEVVNVRNVVIETKIYKIELISIILSPTKTILRKYVTTKVPNTTFCSTKDDFIEDVNSGKRFYIQKSSIGYNSKKMDENPQYFNEEYPVLPIDTKYISIYSGSSYIINHLKIR